MSKKGFLVVALLVLLAFAIPIEHKYDKLFRFYSLTLIPQGLEISKSYDKKIYFYISDLIALVLFCIGLVRYRLKMFSNPLWIVFFCAVLSIMVSPFLHYPVAYVRLLQLFTPIALFSFVSMERPQITRVILMALVAAGLFQSVIAIAQYFHQAPLGLRILGETTERTIFIIQDGSRWLIDQILHRPSDTTIVMRASGTFPHANVFGGFMVLSLLATYALSEQKLLLFTLPIQFFAMSLSYSRSALFAWGISTFIWFGLMIYRKKDRKVTHIAWMLALSFALSATLLHNQYLHRGGVISYTQLAKDSDKIRKYHQTTAFEIIKDHPFFGLGLSQFSERTTEYFSEASCSYARTTAPHNMFLFLACETGLISVAALLFFIASLFYSFLKSPITVETVTFASLLVGFLFIGCCDFYPILFQQGKLMFFLIAGLLAANSLQRDPECAKLLSNE